MTTRIIESEYDRRMLIRFIEGHALPFTASLTTGKHRTDRQNKLQRQWMNEIASQLGDRTAEEVRGLCKLQMGVPIRRRDDEVYAEKYDRLIKPLPYEAKIEMMMEPMDFPVTRDMTTKQKTEYLDAVHKYWSERGIILTNPEARAA